MRHAKIPGGLVPVALSLMVSFASPSQAQVVADFTGAPLFGCSPLTVNFADTSTGPVEQWLWDFGDGQFSDQQNPSHTYDAPGVYSVALTAAAAGGAPADIETAVNYVQTIGPAVNFVAAPDSFASLPAIVNFTDLTIFGAPITSWTWDFGDGNGSSLQNPSHAYTGAGLYQVSLTVTDIDGCSRTETKPGLIQVLAGLSATMTDEVIENPAGNGRAQPGSVIRYTLTLQNTGDQTLDDTEVQVLLDASASVVEESDQ